MRANWKTLLWMMLAMALVLAWGCGGDKGPKKGVKKSNAEDPFLDDDDDFDLLDDDDLILPDDPSDKAKRENGQHEPGEDIGGTRKDEDKAGENDYEPIFDALNYIPKSVHMMGMVLDPQDLSDQLGIPEISKNFKKEISDFTILVKQMTGRNLLDPTIIEQNGISLSHPMGVFLPKPTDKLPIFFVTLKNPKAFKTLINELGDSSRVKEIDDAFIIPVKGKSGAILAMRGGTGFLILPDDNGDPNIEAVHLAKQKIQTSIGYGDENSAIFNELQKETSFIGFIDIAAIAGVKLNEMLEQAQHRHSFWSEQALERFKDNPNSLERIQSLKDELDKLFLARQLAWEQAEAKRRAIKTVVEPLQEWFIGISVQNGKIKFFTRITNTLDMPSHLFQKMSNLPPIIADTLNGSGNLVFGAHVEMGIFKTLLFEVVRANVPDFEAFKTAFKLSTGLELETEALRMLSGEAQLGLSLVDNLVPTTLPALMQNLQLSALLGVRDEEAAIKQFDTAFNTLTKLGLAGKDEENKQLTIELPGGQLLYLGMARKYLTLSTDKTFISRVIAGMGGEYIENINDPDLKGILLGKNLTIFGLIDLGKFFSVKQLLSVDNRAAEAPLAQRFTRADETPEYVALAESITAQIMLIRETDTKIEKLESENSANLRNILGPIGVRLEPHPRGMNITGFLSFNQELKPTMAELALTFRNATNKMNNLERQLKLREDTLEKLNKEINEFDNLLNKKLQLDREKETKAYHDQRVKDQKEKQDKARAEAKARAKAAREAIERKN
jgi:hypothetical protein